VFSETEKMLEDLIKQWQTDFPGRNSVAIAIALRLRHLYQLDQEAVQDVLMPFDVGLGEVDVLACLRQQAPPYRLRPIDLADMCMVTTGAITGRISRLERRGYVMRVPSASDKRTVYVQMTDAGDKLVQKIHKSIDGSSRFLRAIRTLPESDQERFNKILIKLIHILRA
jgi:DNA-binding MarR family transcriptional regulator